MSGSVLVTLWAIGLISLGVGVWLSLRSNRNAARPGCCVACNYDLYGLPPGSKCPECGLSPSSRPTVPILASISAFVAPMVCGTLVTLLADMMFIGWWGLGAMLFAAIPISLSYALPAAILFVLWYTNRRHGLLGLSLGASLTITLVNCLVLYDAGVVHPDAQNGIVIIMLPFLGPGASGFGWLAASLVIAALDRKQCSGKCS